MYSNPRNIFQSKVENILNENKDQNDLFQVIFQLTQFLTFEKSPIKGDIDQWKSLMELYSTFGSTQFARIITIMKGKTINFPTEEEFQDCIITSLCYYYKEIMNLSWDEIKEKLKTPRLNSIKYGIRVRQLRSFIDEQLLQRLTKK